MDNKVIKQDVQTATTAGITFLEGIRYGSVAKGSFMLMCPLQEGYLDSNLQ
jgi:hypothetical protein